jgi:hypothetical protein
MKRLQNKAWVRVHDNSSMASKLAMRRTKREPLRVTKDQQAALDALMTKVVKPPAKPKVRAADDPGGFRAWNSAMTSKIEALQARNAALFPRS